MKMRYFYKKNDLFKLINTPKSYPTSQIYVALTQIINDNAAYITDKYGRTGYLVNIGDYYLFQPSELNYKNISIYDRSAPIDYKHNMINFQIKSDVIKPVIDKRSVGENIIEEGVEDIEDVDVEDVENMKEIKEKIIIEGKKVLDDMFSNYNLSLETSNVPRGSDNWYQLCGLVIRNMAVENDIIPADDNTERLKILESFLIEHIVDSLMMDEKIMLLNYIYLDKEFVTELTNKKLKEFYGKMKKYLTTKLIVSKGITGIVIFNGPSRIDNFNMFVLKDDNLVHWVPAEPQDILDLQNAILLKYKLKPKARLSQYVGFIGFETNKKYMIYQIKDTTNERSTGFRCEQSGKAKTMNILNEIEGDSRYSKETKEGLKELCVRQELTLRSYERLNITDKTWFLDTETAIINEFQKKEKGKK